MDERGEGSVADVDALRGDVDGDRIVEEDDLLVRVSGGDGEIQARVEGIGGEVEGGELEGGDGERWALGAVEDPYDAAGDGGKEEQGEEEDDEPDAADAASVAAAPPAAGLGGGAVGLAGGVVQLGFRGREGGAVEGPWRRIGCGGGFCSWIDSVRHLLSISD